MFQSTLQLLVYSSVNADSETSVYINDIRRFDARQLVEKCGHDKIIQLTGFIGTKGDMASLAQLLLDLIPVLPDEVAMDSVIEVLHSSNTTTVTEK